MSPAFVLIAALVFAPPPPTDPRNLRAPALEAVVQELRPFDAGFVKRAPIELDLKSAIDIYHRLWHLGIKGARLAGKDAALANSFRTIAAQARVATYAAMTAEPYFRVARRTELPIISPADARRTDQMAATVVARGEEVQRAISRILAQFPLWTDDSAWGYRPPPTDEPAPRFSR